ncbi:MAG: GT4 family glycosyltransferase PelF [Gammaproteobacteria bacterium]|nr:GT4 family glycosyltransferase PelF [Gammaproteobacteria bacterium]
MVLYPGKLKAKSVDIALIVESSYPYIMGGVSTWVEQILLSFPQYKFALIFLGGSPDNYKDGIRYKIPPNVTHFQVHYLFGDEKPPAHLKQHSEAERKKSVESMLNVHKAFRCSHIESMNEIGNLDLYKSGTGLDYQQFLYSETSWQILTEQYTENCPDISFIDYFWTVRNIHKPLWIIADIVVNFPKARLVHTASTGYSGLLAFLVNKHRKFPVTLTEHGIYTKERRIDVFLSSNFRDDYVIDHPLADLSYLRTMWDRYFKTLAQLCYNIAQPIASLSKSANIIQVEEGADAKKTVIIPNGVDIERFKKLRQPYEKKSDLVCLVGRIVAMKDVKGFIRAVPKIHSAVPDYKFWIIGSIDQDPIYAEECHALVENISFKEHIKFHLHQNMDDVLPKVRLMVLSGIREGMPFVILESFAAGIPVIATDVGACREMVLGADDADKAIGPAGKIVKTADTESLEQAIIEILTDEKEWKKMSKAAIQRVERYYDQKIIMKRYGEIYKKQMTD